MLQATPNAESHTEEPDFHLRNPYKVFATVKRMWEKRQGVRWIIALLITAATLASSAVAVKLHIGVAAAIPGFMLLALLASWRAGFTSAVIVSFASTICLDYFFTEPKFSLSIYSYQDVLALTSFVAVSVFVSHMVQRIREYGLSLEAREKEQRLLFQLSQSILLADWNQRQEEHLCRAVQDQLGLRGVAYWDDKASRCWSSGDAADAEESLIACFRAGVDRDLPTRDEQIRILHFGARRIGAVLFRGKLAAPLFTSAIAAIIASNIERVRAMRAEVLSQSVAFSEQLRTAVLDGLAHSVKTPLTTIGISASGLLEIGNLSPLQQQFARTIEEQAFTISALTDKLLKTSRLDRRDISLHRRSLPLMDIYEYAIADLPQELVSGRVNLICPEADLHVTSDPEVLRMALAQLLENGLKYSPADSELLVTISHHEGQIEIAVHNKGSFIPPDERQVIFERYYRSPSTEHKAPGTGLGLSIAKRAIEMHGGSIHVKSSLEHGTIFTLSIPKGEAC